MEVEPAGIITIPTSQIQSTSKIRPTVDLDKVEGAAACLELIEESKERSLSKERSQTSLISENEESSESMSAENIQQVCEINQNVNSEEDKSQQKYIQSSTKSLHESISNASEDANQSVNEPSKKSDVFESKVPNENNTNVRNEAYLLQDAQLLEPTEGDFKKLKERAMSLDFEPLTEQMVPAKPTERRRLKIFETAKKFNQLASPVETEKPKKIFIPGVNVGGAKRAFERKASLSSITTPPPAKASASKVIIDVPTDKKSEKNEKQQTSGQEIAACDDKSAKWDEVKKRAVDIISGAIGKPPMQRKLNGSPPITPQSSDSKKIGLKIAVAPNDIRSATASVSTPVETKFILDAKSSSPEATVSAKRFITLHI